MCGFIYSKRGVPRQEKNECLSRGGRGSSPERAGPADATTVGNLTNRVQGLGHSEKEVGSPTRKYEGRTVGS